MVDGPARTSSSAASALEPTGWPVAENPATTLRSSSSWRGVSTPRSLRAGNDRLAALDDLLAVLLGLGLDDDLPVALFLDGGGDRDLGLGQADAAELHA